MNPEELFDVRTTPFNEPEPGLQPRGRNAVLLNGGLGDGIILARVVQNRADIDLFVKPNHLVIIRQFLGDRAKPITTWGSPEVRDAYKGMVDASRYVFDEHDRFVDTDYHQTAADYLGIELPEYFLEPRRASVPSPHPLLNSGVPFIAIHAGASNPNRRLPKVFWKRLIAQMLEMHPDKEVIFIGGPGDLAFTSPRCHCLWEHPGCQNILHNMAVLQHPNCNLLYCGDSGMAHLAGALDVPSFVFFTCTVPEAVLKQYPQSHGLWPVTRPSELARSKDPFCLQAARVQAQYLSSKCKFILPALKPYSDERKELQNSLEDVRGVLAVVEDSLVHHPNVRANLCEHFWVRGIHSLEGTENEEVLLYRNKAGLWLRNGQRTYPVEPSVESIRTAVMQTTN